MTITENLANHEPSREAFMEGFSGKAGISGAVSSATSIHSSAASFLPSTLVSSVALSATVSGVKNWELIDLDPDEIQG